VRHRAASGRLRLQLAARFLGGEPDRARVVVAPGSRGVGLAAAVAVVIVCVREALDHLWLRDEQLDEGRVRRSERALILWCCA
jgi:hypothetical protein